MKKTLLSVLILISFIKHLIYVLNLLRRSHQSNTIEINWSYNNSDLDLFKTAQIISETVNLPFNYVKESSNDFSFGNLQKPIKPELEEYDLDENRLKIIDEFIDSCKKRSNRYLLYVFIICVLISILIVYSSNIHKAYFALFIVASGTISWLITPVLFLLFSKQKIDEYLFNTRKNELIFNIYRNRQKYELALSKYKEDNKLFERAIRRTAWQYWLSLSPREFEEAVGQLFLDEGYEVWITKNSKDHGVDLFLVKDNKNYVVQCKTYKRPLGPNVVRDLYGTMIANHADEAFLAAPMGFSNATKDFCKGKPITLLDIDELTKMTYNFENYIPRWLETASSIDDVVKHIHKNILR
ncbi:MAG: restriction endonuclease [Bacteroidales bacterium]